MTKIASIDIGTNSVKLLVARVDSRGVVHPLKEMAQTTRLGRGQGKTGRLDRAGVQKTIRVLKNYTRLAQKYGADKIIAAATSAVRESKNKNSFLKKIFRETALKVKVLTVRQEAFLAYRGVVSGCPVKERRTAPITCLTGRQASGPARLVIDIGGGSAELVWGINDRPAGYKSLPLGAVKLTERFIRNDPVTQKEYDCLVLFIKKQITFAFSGGGAGSAAGLVRWMGKYRPSAKKINVIGAGGAAVTLAALTPLFRYERAGLAQKSRPRAFFILSSKKLRLLINRLKKSDLAVRRRMLGRFADRADIILSGAAALQCLMQALNLKRIAISPRGLRYGLILLYLKKYFKKIFP
ncbi:MAG: Ppx/GppA phosphatase family protein [Planctomycetota bacterium]